MILEVFLFIYVEQLNFLFMKTVLLLIATFMFSQISFAEKDENKGNDYRRSSLCIIMLDEDRCRTGMLSRKLF